MKQYFFLLALAAGISAASMAQNGKTGTGKGTAPKAAQVALVKNFPGSSAPKWDKEGANYEAEFKQQGNEMSAEFTGDGVLLETEVTIKTSELPASVLKYVKEHYKGAAIKEAAKITKANGEVSYEAEVNKKDVIFDTNGKFLKEETD